jgi:2-desacetyl-2-hydroxyethyl bacteriochlorophyllide A dehydrogenase
MTPVTEVDDKDESSASMQRVVVREGGIDLVETQKPTPKSNEALVQMVYSGVCGSDTHAAAGHHPFVPLPYLPGHEVVGIVRDVGEDVKDAKVDDHVTVDPTLPCWNCKMCRTDRSNLCENLRFFGCGYSQGGMADYFTIPADRLHVIPSGISDLSAILIEPLATPVHAVRLSGGVADKAVVIIGAGTIGLLTLAAARHAGARTIIMTDMLASKRERALQLGADQVFDAASPDLPELIRAELGESVDVVFDCVSIQSTVNLAIDLALKAGTVMIVGVPAGPVTIPLPVIQDLQVRIQGSATYMPEDYATATEIIQSGAVTPERFVTAQFSLLDVSSAFAASASGEHVKVVVKGEVGGVS